MDGGLYAIIFSKEGEIYLPSREITTPIIRVTNAPCGSIAKIPPEFRFLNNTNFSYFLMPALGEEIVTGTYEEGLSWARDLPRIVGGGNRDGVLVVDSKEPLYTRIDRVYDSTTFNDDQRIFGDLILKMRELVAEE